MHHKYHRSALHKTGIPTSSALGATKLLKLRPKTRNCLNFGQKQRMVHALQLAGLSSLIHDSVAAASLESFCDLTRVSSACTVSAQDNWYRSSVTSHLINRLPPRDVTFDVLRAMLVKYFFSVMQQPKTAFLDRSQSDIHARTRTHTPGRNG